MTRKVGIIGMGHVGSTIAYGLIVHGTFDDYVLIDTNEAKVKADTPFLLEKNIPITLSQVLLFD